MRLNFAVILITWLLLIVVNVAFLTYFGISWIAYLYVFVIDILITVIVYSFKSPFKEE